MFCGVFVAMAFGAVFSKEHCVAYLESIWKARADDKKLLINLITKHIILPILGELIFALGRVLCACSKGLKDAMALE